MKKIVFALLLVAVSSSAQQIKYVFHIRMENRSFDEFFGTFPNANGATSGKISTGATVSLLPAGDTQTDCGHAWVDAHNAMNQVAGVYQMDSFDKVTGCVSPPYQAYVQQSSTDIPQAWALAQTYALADYNFSR